MPQFDLSIFPGQIFWLIIFFSALMVYTVTISVPRMKKILDERWESTEGYRIEADRLKDEHGALMNEMAKDLAVSRQQAHDQILKVQSELATEFSGRKREMLSLTKVQIADAEARIAQQRRYSANEIAQFTQGITLTLLEKLLPVGGSATELKTVVEGKFVPENDDQVVHPERRKNGI